MFQVEREHAVDATHSCSASVTDATVTRVDLPAPTLTSSGELNCVPEICRHPVMKWVDEVSAECSDNAGEHVMPLRLPPPLFSSLAKPQHFYLTSASR